MTEQNIKPHPGTAAVLSFVFNGLGQIYNGQILKGLIIVLLSSLSLFLVVIGAIPIAFWLSGKMSFSNTLFFSIGLFLVGLVCVCAISIYSVFDAYREAKRQ